MQDLDYYFCFGRINFDRSTPDYFVVKATNAEASAAAWEVALQEVDSYSGLHGVPTSFESEEEYEEWADYCADIANQEALDDGGIYLWEALKREVACNEDNFEEICKKYGLTKPR